MDSLSHDMQQREQGQKPKLLDSFSPVIRIYITFSLSSAVLTSLQDGKQHGFGRYLTLGPQNVECFGANLMEFVVFASGRLASP